MTPPSVLMTSRMLPGDVDQEEIAEFVKDRLPVAAGAGEDVARCPGQTAVEAVTAEDGAGRFVREDDDVVRVRRVDRNGGLGLIAVAGRNIDDRAAETLLSRRTHVDPRVSDPRRDGGQGILGFRLRGYGITRRGGGPRADAPRQGKQHQGAGGNRSVDSAETTVRFHAGWPSSWDGLLRPAAGRAPAARKFTRPDGVLALQDPAQTKGRLSIIVHGFFIGQLFPAPRRAAVHASAPPPVGSREPAARTHSDQMVRGRASRPPIPQAARTATRGRRGTACRAMARIGRCGRK